MRIKTTEEKVNEGLKELKANGAIVETSGNSGGVAIQGVEALYKFEEGILSITITDKPWLVSEDFVEGKIRSYFN